ncbi:MAG: hypothetical protein IPN71_08900 [Fibrobacteres bacterium]|nr:hypothetical protein [Fibrobacterota bacterium]
MKPTGVIVDLWGTHPSPPTIKWAMVFAQVRNRSGPILVGGWCPTDQGHVDGKDATSINFDELLTAFAEIDRRINLDARPLAVGP